MVVGETVVEEVPIGESGFGLVWSSFILAFMELAVDRVHRHKVAGVLTISKEFETESWNKGLASVRCNGR